MPSIGLRDGRLDEKKTNWQHSFFSLSLFFAAILLNTESTTEEKQEEILFYQGQLGTHF